MVCAVVRPDSVDHRGSGCGCDRGDVWLVCQFHQAVTMDVWFVSFVRSYGAACPSCRRTLGEPEPQCPRCGVELRLGVKIPQLYLLAWGITLTTCAVMAGCGLFLLFLIARRPSNLHRGDWVEFSVLVTVCGLGVLMAVAAVVLAGWRQGFCRLPRWTQWLLAGGALCLLLMGAVGLVAVLH
jgi:hypothetical protein